MDFELAGRHAVVTGGTRGIGRAIVLALADQGMGVTTCYTQEGTAAEALTEELETRDAQAQVVRADIRSVADVRRLLDEAYQAFGPVHALVNNAGVISHMPLDELAPREWDRVVDTNLGGMYRVVRAALPKFASPASIVNISSGAGRAGMPNAAHYVASKAGVFGYTRALCKELGPRGIRVNAIASGTVDNTGQMNLRRDEGMARYATAMTSLKRLGQPEDIADVVAFLVSDAARYVTGAVVEVDGGI